MAFFDRTATHMLSLIAAVYGVFVYTISFSLEMWFIITSPVAPPPSASSHLSPTSSSLSSSTPKSSLYPSEQTSYSRNLAFNREIVVGNSETEAVPVYAFILAAVYFAMVMVSLLLMLGIIIHSMICVSAWLIAVVLLFFPEAALVFFITIYSWGMDSRNGQIELCFYVIRVILNIFFVICVQNLLSQWKSDKQASNFAFNLNSYHSEPPLTSNTPYIGVEGCSTTVNPVFKFAPSQFDARTLNAAYESTGVDTLNYLQLHEENMYKHDDLNDLMSRKRSASNLSERYSSQSLDRRKKQNPSPFSKEEVVLQPMSHRPFDYLHRPGSSADIRSLDYDTSPHQPSFEARLSHSQSFIHKPYLFSSRTLPRHFERISSIQSLRDVAL